MEKLSKWSVGVADHKGDYVVIIPKGSPLPARRCITVTTSRDLQSNMKLAVYMGESKRASGNYPLSNISLECCEKLPAGGTAVRLTFNLYTHSVMRISVCYRDNETPQEVDIVPVSGLSEAQMARLREVINLEINSSTPREVCSDTPMVTVVLG
ncbi:MAG: Hsp70 family protein [Dehalococcoidia bacterium]|nr:Hsp70 family protein [Dehalococcoidia bacterium]